MIAQFLFINSFHAYDLKKNYYKKRQPKNYNNLQELNTKKEDRIY